MNDPYNELVEEIEYTFQDIPVPTRLTYPRFEVERSFEIGLINNYFLGKTWQQITPTVLKESASVLIYLTPEALYYYLPAYFILAANYYESDYAGDRILSFFTAEESDATQYELFKLLSPEQKQVIMKLFTYLHKYYPEDDIPEPSPLLQSD